MPKLINIYSQSNNFTFKQLDKDIGYYIHYSQVEKIEVKQSEELQE